MIASSRFHGPVLVALSGMLFGLMGFLGTKLLYLHFTVENMLFWRFLVATLWMLGFVVVGLRWHVGWAERFFAKPNDICWASQKNAQPNLRANEAQQPRKKSGTSSLVKIFILGAISYSCGTVFFFMASTHIGTGLAMVIFFSFPVFVTLFAWLFDNWKMNRYAFGSLMAVIIGLLLLKGDGEHALDVTGVILAVIAAFSFAAYVYGSQHTTKAIDSRLLTILVCLGNLLIFLGISIYSNSFVIPTSLSAWFYIFALGILATALPIQFLLDGLKYVSPVNASILSALEPVVTVIIGLALLDETMSYVQSLGVFIVILGAILIQFERTPEQLNNQESSL